MGLRRPAWLSILILGWAVVAAAQARTMRLDYYHTGNATSEVFSVDRVVLEPLPWPGSPKRNIDDTNLGKYFFEVRDESTKQLLFSRGFASMFGEWETTDEAKSEKRTFNESLRFPSPLKPVVITLKKRNQQNGWQDIWQVRLDPKDIYIDDSKPPSAGPLISIERNGRPEEKVDFLILGDGYTNAERGKCEADAKRLTRILFSTTPFRESEKKFNVWALCPAAAESGISRPSTGVHRRSPVGATYDALQSERYVLTFDNHALRDLASQAPYEFLEIITNSQTYGGGGIFGLYSTVAADSEWAPYIFVHEFGHHFAGLADEYYTSDVAVTNSPHVEPWEPNVTALLDPSMLKWRSLVDRDTPIPTPWPKSNFEAMEKDVQAKRREIRKTNRPEEEMNALFRQERDTEEKLLADGPFSGRVGAFEGADYEAKGYYRPESNCIMFTRTANFCRVCQQAIKTVIHFYSE